MRKTTINQDIKDVIMFARSMGIHDATCVILTTDMLKDVCKNAGIEYKTDRKGRMVAGRFTFYVRNNPDMDKAIVVRPSQLPGALK